MKIGFPNHPRKNLIKEIEWIGKNGFDFVDLFLEEDGTTPEKIDVERVKKILKKYNLEAVGHMAWYLPIGSPVKSFRETAIKEAIRYLKIFRKLGVKFVTIHANWPGSLFSMKKGINFQIESLKKLTKEAKKYRINLMYELIDTQNDSMENIAKILKSVSGLFFHLDIGHANLFGKNPEKFIKKFYPKLKHIHMHDNAGDIDSHLALGKGTINWINLVKIMKKYYNGTITLEIFSKDKNEALASKEKLKKLWNKK